MNCNISECKKNKDGKCEAESSDKFVANWCQRSGNYVKPMFTNNLTNLQIEQIWYNHSH